MMPSVSPHRRRGPIARVLATCHAAVGLLLVTAPASHGQPLSDLLQGVAANARFEHAARADVRIACGEGCTASDRPAILVGRGDALYVEVKDGQRALVRPGHIMVAREGKAVEAPTGEPFAGTEVLLEDLAVFTPRSLRVPQISDDGPAGVVVTSAPAGPSAYALLVHTIDRDRRAIVRTLYYRDLINNLTKTRRNDAWVQAAGGWRPGEIVIESMRQATTTRLTLAWHDAPDAAPDLFEPAGLEHPSALRWP